MGGRSQPFPTRAEQLGVPVETTHTGVGTSCLQACPFYQTFSGYILVSKISAHCSRLPHGTFLLSSLPPCSLWPTWLDTNVGGRSIARVVCSDTVPRTLNLGIWCQICPTSPLVLGNGLKTVRGRTRRKQRGLSGLRKLPTVLTLRDSQV